MAVVAEPVVTVLGAPARRQGAPVVFGAPVFLDGDAVETGGVGRPAVRPADGRVPTSGPVALLARAVRRATVSAPLGHALATAEAGRPGRVPGRVVAGVGGLGAGVPFVADGVGPAVVYAVVVAVGPRIRVHSPGDADPRPGGGEAEGAEAAGKAVLEGAWLRDHNGRPRPTLQLHSKEASGFAVER